MQEIYGKKVWQFEKLMEVHFNTYFHSFLISQLIQQVAKFSLSIQILDIPNESYEYGSNW